MREEDQFLLQADPYPVVLNTEQEYINHFNSLEFHNYLKDTYGRKYPWYFIIQLNGQSLYVHLKSGKFNIPMDWVYYAGYEKITKKVIQAEENIEKRRLLMMEYGLEDFFEDKKVIHKDIYGELIEATIDGERARFLRCIDGSVEKDEDTLAYYRKMNGVTDDNKRIHYVPVEETVKTAREAAAWSWGIPEKELPETGWDVEA